MRVKLTTDTFLRAGIVLLLSAVIGMIAITIDASQKINDTAKRVVHSQEVLFHSQKLLSLLADNETSSIGYIITGKKTFLASFQKSQKETNDELTLLKKLTGDFPEQLIRIDSISLNVEKRVAFLNSSISSYELKSANASSTLVETVEGKLYTERIRFFVNNIQSAENTLLQQQKLTNERSTLRLNNMLVAIAIAVLLLAIIILLLVRFQFSSLKRNKVEFKVQEQLKTGELNSSFERITDAFVAFNNNWKVTYMNKKAGEILGKETAMMLGKNIWNELPKGIDQPFYKAYHAAMENQQSMHVQEYDAAYDRWLEHHIYPSKEGLSVFFRDITEQKRNDKELELREERFRVLLENNPAIISLTDDALNSIYRSPSSTHITGRTEEDMKTTSGINHVHPDDIPILKTTIAEAIKNPGIPQPYLSRYLHKNGHYIWLEGTATKLPDESILKGIVFNSRDVTEKIELEDLLLKANRLARIGSWNVDLVKQTVYWNDITREIHEADNSFVPDLATGINFYKEGPGRELITQKVKEAIELGKPWDEELEIVTVKNNLRWIRTIGETEFVDGKCVKIYGSFQDIDQRKRAEEKQIESINRYRRLFDTSPIAITEEDHTPFYEKIESLRTLGISKNYAAYFDQHSEELYEMLGRVQILGVNQSLLDLTGAHNLEDFVANRSKFFVSMTEMTVFKLMDLIRDGGGYFEEETKIKSLSGEIKEVIVRLKYPAAPPYNSVAITMRDVTKQKESEQKIRDSEEKQKTILQSLLDYVVIVNADGEIQYVNHFSTGLTEAETVGSNFLLWLHEEDHLEAKKAIANTLSSGVFSEIQVRANGPERIMTWFNVKIIRMPEVSSQQVLLVVTDITEQKKSDEKIRLSEIRLLKAQEIGKFGYWQQDLKSDVVWASKEAMRIYGFGTEEGELRRATIASCIIDVEKVKEAALNLVEHGKEYNIDIRINPADGSPMKYISALAELEKNEKGEPVRIVGTLQDITDRKKVEEELRLSENRTRRIFESDMIGFIYWDVNGEILDANDLFLQMTGYSKQDLKDNKINWSKMTPPEYLYLDEIGLEQIAKTGVCQPFEKEYFRKDGSRMAILIGATVLEGSNFGTGVSYVLDITERIKAENKLKENEIYLQTILDTEPECVKILNNKGELLSMNPAGLAMIEADNEQQVLGHRMTELVDEKYRMGFNRLSKEVFNGKSGTFEFEVTGLKGGRRWLETHAVPLKDTGGNIINLLGVTTDITNRKLGELEFAESELKYRRLFESAKDGIFILNADTGFIEDVNPFLCDMLNYSHAEFLNKQLWEISLFKDIAANKESFLKLKVKKYVRYENLPLVTKSGETIWVEFISNVYDVKGKPVIQCSIRNITDRKIAEDEIIKTTEELRQLTDHLQTIREEERKRIAREIHDELGQQLTAIKMDLAWIDKKIGGETNLAELKTTFKSKLHNLITLVDGSNESVRKILNELRHGILEDNGLLDALEWQGNQFTEAAGVPLKFFTSETSLLLPDNIANCLFRLYQESLTNIARYAQATKVISSLKIEDGNITLTVEDDGNGFDVKILQNNKSFGILGMKERVLSLNGNFELLSVIGKGTKIEIRLPLKKGI